MNRFMRTLAISLLFLLASTAGLLAESRKPNIILIFVDDLGWKDTACYGNDFFETPHIDQLANDGVRFTDFYAAGAVCSPTRCAVQSGQNQARIGITDFIPGHWRPFEKVITPMVTAALPLDTITIAENLKTAGYSTGYIGKWHLGNAPRYHPNHQGYDVATVINGPHFAGKYRVQRLPGQPDYRPMPGQYRTDFEAMLSEAFILEATGNPFFLSHLTRFTSRSARCRKRSRSTGRRREPGETNISPTPFTPPWSSTSMTWSGGSWRQWRKRDCRITP